MSERAFNDEEPSPLPRDRGRLANDLGKELLDNSLHVRTCFRAYCAGHYGERDALLDMVRMLAHHAAQMEIFARRRADLDTPPLVFRLSAEAVAALARYLPMKVTVTSSTDERVDDRQDQDPED